MPVVRRYSRDTILKFNQKVEIITFLTMGHTCKTDISGTLCVYLKFEEKIFKNEKIEYFSKIKPFKTGENLMK